MTMVWDLGIHDFRVTIVGDMCSMNIVTSCCNCGKNTDGTTQRNAVTTVFVSKKPLFCNQFCFFPQMFNSSLSMTQ